MASFNRTRLAGLWTALSPLLHTEMEHLDDKTSKALNAEEGGSWAPSTKIEIGGEGIKITGLAEFTGEFKVTSEAKLQGGAHVSGGNLTVSLHASIQGNLGVDGTLTVAGASTLDNTTVQGDLNVSTNLDVQGTSHLAGNVTADNDIGCERLAIHGAHEGSNAFTLRGSGYVSGGFTVMGAAQVGGALTLLGNASVAGTLTVTDNATLNGTTVAKGRFKRRVLTMTDAATTVSVSDYDLVYVSSTVLTANRSLAISTTGAEEGDVVRFITKNSTHSVDVDWGDGAVSFIVANDKQQWLEVTLIGGVWVRTGFGDRVDPLPNADALRLRARKPFTTRLVVGADVAVFSARWCPGLAAPSAAPSGVRVAGRASAVACAFCVADLRALATPRTGAGLLFSRGADLRGGRVIVRRTGEKSSEEQRPEAHPLTLATPRRGEAERGRPAARGMASTAFHSFPQPYRPARGRGRQRRLQGRRGCRYGEMMEMCQHRGQREQGRRGGRSKQRRLFELPGPQTIRRARMVASSRESPGQPQR